MRRKRRVGRYRGVRQDRERVRQSRYADKQRRLRRFGSGRTSLGRGSRAHFRRQFYGSVPLLQVRVAAYERGREDSEYFVGLRDFPVAVQRNVLRVESRGEHAFALAARRGKAVRNRRHRDLPRAT